ncbi:unnamed protein product [Symbiodinium microadriaticum]|nr:unnamed protein product [Symbiodinium sp. KB8]CAE7838348.1 unnamed protein product [Symbiodinium microadriaticum]
MSPLHSTPGATVDDLQRELKLETSDAMQDPLQSGPTTPKGSATARASNTSSMSALPGRRSPSADTSFGVEALPPNPSQVRQLAKDNAATLDRLRAENARLRNLCAERGLEGDGSPSSPRRARSRPKGSEAQPLRSLLAQRPAGPPIFATPRSQDGLCAKPGLPTGNWSCHLCSESLSCTGAVHHANTQGHIPGDGTVNAGAGFLRGSCQKHARIPIVRRTVSQLVAAWSPAVPPFFVLMMLMMSHSFAGSVSSLCIKKKLVSLTVFILSQESAPAHHGAMTASNVDLEPESEEEEVPEGKDGEAVEPPEPAEPGEQGEGEPAAFGVPVPDELMPELNPAAERPVELGDSFLDGPNGHLRAELAIRALTVDGAPVPLLVEADALDVTQEPMEIEYDDEVLQLGELTDPWILPDYAEQDAAGPHVVFVVAVVLL